MATPSLLELGRFRSAFSHSRISPGSTRRTKTSRSATVNATPLLLAREALSKRRGNCRTALSGPRSSEAPSSNPRAVTRLPSAKTFRRSPPARRRQHHACRRMETPKREKRRQQAAGRRQLAANRARGTKRRSKQSVGSRQEAAGSERGTKTQSAQRLTRSAGGEEQRAAFGCWRLAVSFQPNQDRAGGGNAPWKVKNRPNHLILV